MGRNWLERALGSNQSQSLTINGDENDDGNNLRTAEDESVRASFAALNISLDSEETSSFQLSLLPMDEIYNAAGIVSPQKGYSAHKVVETLHSEHIAGLSAELKRAAVLMALDAAGVSVDQIQQDAKSRREALDSYEAEQRKLVEAEWARRAEDTMQIQAELERVKTYYMARINRNLIGVAREKAVFNGWLELKKREAKAMSGALDLCVKTTVSKPSSAPLSKAAAARSKANSA
jgi:hypothetical protein